MQLDFFAPASDPGSSVEDSPARTSLRQVTGLALQAPGPGSGASSLDSLASFDRSTSSWRTSQRSFIEDWARYSETWPRSGLMRSGTAYLLPVLVPLTEETESGLLPTPTGTPYGTTNNGRRGDGTTYRTAGTPSLDTMARQGLWPTPCAADWNARGDLYAKLHNVGRQRWPTPTADDANNATRVSGQYQSLTRAVRWPTPTAGDAKAAGSRNTPQSNANPGLSLTDAVRADGGTGRWPTPTGRDWRGPNTLPYAERGGGTKGEQLPNAVGGALNPRWVEWLMAYPDGWTDLGR